MEFGAATLLGLSITGAVTDPNFDFVAGSETLNSVSLVGLTSNSFSGTDDAVLFDGSGGIVIDFANSSQTADLAAGQTLIDNSGGNLFAPQLLGDAVLQITSGVAHLRGFDLLADLSYDIEPAAVPEPGSASLLGLVALGLGTVRRRR